jgi:hypothetical protein
MQEVNPMDFGPAVRLIPRIFSLGGRERERKKTYSL